jgi:hypothetical protein
VRRAAARMNAARRAWPGSPAAAAAKAAATAHDRRITDHRRLRLSRPAGAMPPGTAGEVSRRVDRGGHRVPRVIHSDRVAGPAEHGPAKVTTGQPRVRVTARSASQVPASPAPPPLTRGGRCRACRVTHTAQPEPGAPRRSHTTPAPVDIRWKTRSSRATRHAVRSLEASETQSDPGRFPGHPAGHRRAITCDRSRCSTPTAGPQHSERPAPPCPQ